MKHPFTFHFLDDPQYQTIASRTWCASALRAYRKHRDRYILRRIAPHAYTVQTVLSTAVALIQRSV